MQTKYNVAEAVENLITMFREQNFPERVAFTIIRKKNSLAGKPSDNWSIGNLMIMAFIGKTGDARTFKQWLAVNRCVKRGAKAFRIYAPIIHKIKKDNVSADEDDYIVLGFKALPVFRIEDTEGEPVRTPDYTPPEMPPFYDVAEKLGLTVNWKAFNGEAYGWYNTKSKVITLSSEDAFIYFHELAHAVNATFADLNKDRQRAEIVADFTAAVLCELQGISGYQYQTYEYVKYYCRDKSDKAVIKTVMGVLNEVAQIVDIIIETAIKPCSDNEQG